MNKDKLIKILEEIAFDVEKPTTNELTIKQPVKVFIDK